MFMPFIAVSTFERASRAEILIAGDFGLSEKESVNEFGMWFQRFEVGALSENYILYWNYYIWILM